MYNKIRWLSLYAASGGMMLQTGCDVGEAVLATVALAFEIVSVWV